MPWTQDPARARGARGWLKATEMSDDKDTGGRPAFEPTDEMRERVEILVGAKQTEDEIARTLRITPPTLRKHFHDELANGFAARRSCAKLKQYEIGMAGNAAALKAYLAHGNDHYQLPSLDAAPAKEEKLGKKAQQQIAADNPDQSTSIGQLMARRAAETSKPH